MGEVQSNHEEATTSRLQQSLTTLICLATIIAKTILLEGKTKGLDYNFPVRCMISPRLSL